MKSAEVKWRGKHCRVSGHTKSLSITPCDQNYGIAMDNGHRYTRKTYRMKPITIQTEGQTKIKNNCWKRLFFFWNFDENFRHEHVMKRTSDIIAWCYCNASSYRYYTLHLIWDAEKMNSIMIQTPGGTWNKNYHGKIIFLLILEFQNERLQIV